MTYPGVPRPKIVVGRDPDFVRRVRIAVVASSAAFYATVTGHPPPMSVRHLLDRLLPAGELPAVVAEFPGGVRLDLDGAGAVARVAILSHGYEQREIGLLAGAVRPGGVFIDVGANIGWFTVSVALCWPDATVWAVEPVPATADQLTETVQRAGLDQVRVIRAIAGSCVGTSLMHVPGDDALAHRASPASPGPVVDSEMVTVDAVWRRFGCPRVDAMKVDVEGSEVDVLIGAHELLATYHPLLIVEAPTAQDAEAIADVLGQHGYRHVRHRGVLPYNACFEAG